MSVRLPSGSAGHGADPPARRMGPTRRVLTLVALAGAVFAAACDSGPSGPGTLKATVVTSQPMGAVVLELTGGGVTGFESQGSTLAYGAAVVNQTDKYRVVLVSPDGGEMRFGIQVTDVGAARPAVTAVSAATVDNKRLVPQDVQVRIEN